MQLCLEANTNPCGATYMVGMSKICGQKSPIVLVAFVQNNYISSTIQRLLDSLGYQGGQIRII